MRWIRYYFADDDVLLYYEIGDDDAAIRQIDLEGPDRRPVTAAILEEVLYHRDHGGLEAVIAHEAQYGAMAGSMDGGNEVEGVVEITEEEFERVWGPARQALEHPPG